MSQSAVAQGQGEGCGRSASDPSVAVGAPGSVAIAHIIPGAALLAEGILHDAASDRVLISGRQGLFTLAADGSIGLWAARASDRRAIGGLALDPTGDVVWAIATALGPVESRRSTLVRLSRNDGRQLAEYPLPGVDQWYGDLAVGPDGAVYVGNPRTGAFYVLRPGGVALQLMMAPGRVRSPQGMFVTADGLRLIVADYVSGITSVDLRSRVVTPLAVRVEAELRGIDGLVAEPGGLIAFQNGRMPYRVLRLETDEALTEVRAVSVLAEFAADLEPTLGSATDAGALFVARTSWVTPPPNPRTLIGLICPRG